MENLRIDKHSFYDLMEELFQSLGYNYIKYNRINPKVHRKFDNDFYQCEVEDCALIDPNGKMILGVEQVIKSKKLCGNSSISGTEKEYDASYLTLDEIKVLIAPISSKYEFLEIIPNALIAYADTKGTEEDNLVIDKDGRHAICKSVANSLDRDKKEEPTQINMTNNILEEKLGVSYEEYEKLSIEEQYKLIEEKTGVKMGPDCNIHIDGIPIDGDNLDMNMSIGQVNRRRARRIFGLIKK